MSQGTLAPAELRSGNPALSDAFIESQLSPAVAAPRTMSITVSPQRAAVLGALYAVCEGYCLVLDFGTIEAGVEAGAPKELEWYLAVSLMVTLIWLYLTVLRLLAVLSRNR